jgi:ubiquinone/menaquinone biosynthesis C-methylase UbiE
MYGFQKDQVILDVGCGAGKNMEELRPVGRVVGADISKEAVDFCKKRGLKNVVVGDITKLPFKDEKIDVVTALDVIEHVDDRAALLEIKRVLKRTGIVVITVPAYQWLWSEWDVVLHHKKRYTIAALERKLSEVGFRVQKASYMYSFLVIPVYFVRLFKKLFGRRGAYVSDFQIGNRFINKLLLVAALLEQRYIKRYYMPFGTSIICVAQKK